MKLGKNCPKVLCALFPKRALAELGAGGLRWTLQPCATGYISSYEKIEWCVETKVDYHDKAYLGFPSPPLVLVEITLREGALETLQEDNYIRVMSGSCRLKKRRCVTKLFLGRGVAPRM